MNSENKKEGVGRTIIKIILVSIVWLFLYYFILELLGSELRPSSNYKLAGVWIVGQVWIIYYFFKRRSKIEKSEKGWTWIYVLGAILGIVILWSIFISDDATDTNSQTNLDSQTQNSIGKAENSIVWVKYDVEGKNSDGSYFKNGGTGSGVIVGNKNGELTIYTNRHVVDCEFNDMGCFQRIKETVEIRTQDGKIYPVYKVAFSKSDIDLAILYVKVANSETYSFAYYTNEFKTGDNVVAIGYPSYAENVVEFSIKEGKITDTKEVLSQSTGKNYRFIESDAYTYFGSSGGGLFDEQGNLIGINTLVELDSEGTVQESRAIDFSSIDKEEFIYCEEDAYFADGSCYKFCDREQIMGDNRACYDACGEDFYCESTKPTIKSQSCKDEGYVLGNDGFCHPACGGATYCGQGAYCLRNQCLSCSDPNTHLFKDGTCRLYQ
jgi:hypothetical protein